MTDSASLGRALLDSAWITARLAAGLGAITWLVGVGAGLAALSRAERGRTHVRPAAPAMAEERAAARTGALLQCAALVGGGALLALTRGEAERLLPAAAQALVAALAALLGPLGGALGPWSVRALAAGGLMTRGPFGIVRHPLYLSLVLLVGGVGLALGSLSGTTVAAGALLAASAWRARREDRALARAHGEAYQAYAARVRAFGPHW